MKRIIAVLLVTVLAVSLSACGGKSGESSSGSSQFAGQTLHFYNPGEYIGENVLNEFEKKYGCKVMMDNFESNEQMYIKIANGDAYDVIVPSDYMIERLMQEDLLQPLRKDLITCLDLIDPGVLARMDFDPDQT